MKNILLALVVLFTVPPAFASDKQAGEVYDRIVKTRTLRCAYTIYPTFIDKDPNTGKLSGLFYDLTEEIGRQLNLKIEWTEEVPTDAIFEGFRTGRYDAVCPGYFATPSRTAGGDFTRPLVFIPFNMYVRTGESRFKSFADFNNPGVTISTMDGEASQIAVNDAFPQAHQNTLPGTTAATDRFMAVAGGKSDATPMEAAIGMEYMAHNPGKLRQFGDRPLRISGSVLVIPHNEFELKEMLDTTINTMLWTGSLETIIKKHEKYRGTMLPPAQPYQQEGK